MASDPFELGMVEAPATPIAGVGEPPYMSELNRAQREAVEAMDGPVLVLAGAGTGKTRVLITRLAHLIWTGRASPGEILAVTFTNRAARVMSQRVEKLIDRPVAGMAVGTFHSISARFLRQHAELVGLASNFTILDTDDQIRMLKQILELQNIDNKRWPAKVLAGLIDRWKNRAITADELSKNEAYLFADGQAKKLYKMYQERLKAVNAADFGDLLLHMVTIFRAHPDILASYQNRFRYLLVDEYQDTNLTQYFWLRLLAQKNKNICCVGDDDQSIYGWRGAEVGNILKFEKDYEGARVIRLEQNYRSTGYILGAASGLIDANKSRLGKTLWTEAPDGDKIIIEAVWDGKEEARLVSDNIESAQRAGQSMNEMAVLVRAGFQTREFEDRFITLGLPYRVIGGPRFYERREIRDAIAYLRVVAQPRDDLAFERIINVPKRGIGTVTLQRIYQFARRAQISLTEAAGRLAESDELGARARTVIAGLIGDFDRWRALLKTMPHMELIETVLEESGYVEMWQRDKAPDAPGRLENLAELVRATGEFENIEGFLEHISLVMENEEQKNVHKVTIMTLHAAKGLEFDMIFLPGWEEGIFPNQRALDETGLSGLEEERRLAYVGLTRAKKKGHIIYAANRLVFGQWQSSIPSRFIDELPEDCIERRTNLSGAWGGSRDPHDQDLEWSEKPQSSYRPGWSQRAKLGKTLAEKRGQRLTIDGSARRLRPNRPKPLSQFSVGERVFHDKFGYGMIEDVDGDKLTVDFETSGQKRIVDSFVERVEG